MSFAPATRIGPYEVQALLGAGGMGEVYRARDTRLHRLVALKILRSDRVTDPDRQSRLLQEARAASALQHPYIVAVHDILFEQGALIVVLEYVPGKTLDQLISRKGLRLNVALQYAIHMADALAAAHAAGIVHRDLKPSNVIVTDQGAAKLLDFGLAKLLEPHANRDDEETRTDVEGTPKTQEGIVMGTAGYMSPEQAEGKPVDARSDIFSFGAVLYEMITGRRAFHGDSVPSTLSAILRDDPKPPSELTQDVPRDLDKIVMRCLRKDPGRRWQSMPDVRIALQELKEESDSGKLGTVASPVAPRRRRKVYPLAIGIGAAVLLGVAAWVLMGRWEHPTATLSPVPLTGNPGLELYPSFSPDGSQVVYSWNGPRQDNFDLYVKVIGSGDPLRLTTDPAPDLSPIWSPDGRQIAFVRQLSTEKSAVMLVPALGGAERRIADVRTGTSDYVSVASRIAPTLTRMLAWSPDGEWLVIAEPNGEGRARLVGLSVTTAERRNLTTPPSNAAMGDLNPAFSSDGRRLAFSRLTAYQASDLYLLSLSADLRPAGEPKRITFDNRWTDQPDWSADGQSVIFVSNRGGTRTLWQMRSDANRSPELLAFAGDPILTPVAARRGNRLGYVRFLQDMNIWQVNLPEPFHGAETPVRVVSSTLLDASPQISPDGRKLVFQSSRSGALEIWVAESDGSRPVQMTSFGRHSGTPQWSPDGAQIAFDSNVSGVFQIYAMSAEGGTPRILTTGQFENAVPSWSRDGQWIYFSSLRTGAPEIWKMRPNGGDVQQVTRHGGRSVFESPDGPWLYYKKSDSPGPIWRLPVQGGAETMVLPVEVYFRNFAVTAPGIYFMTTAGAINFYRFHTGTSTSVATLRARPAPGLTVSPDEKRIFYSQVDQETSNIMLVDNFR